MKAILLSIIVVGMIGLIIPTAFADIYVHESSFPFSISHPSDWIPSPEDEWGGVNFDSDNTGRNGMGVELWCSEYRGEDCGIAGADYEELNWLKEDTKMSGNIYLFWGRLRLRNCMFWGLEYDPRYMGGMMI